MSDEPAVRIPAEAFPLAELLGDEMEARGWTTDDVAIQMGGDETEIAHNMLVVMLLLIVQRESLFGRRKERSPDSPRHSALTEISSATSILLGVTPRQIAAKPIHRPNPCSALSADAASSGLYDCLIRG